MKKPCWKISNKKDDAIDILLHEEIGFWGTQSQDFLSLLNQNKGKTLNIDINSPGGSVYDGFSIYNALKSHDGKVNVKVSAVAASIASVIMLAGDNREISENAEIMIHNVRGVGRGTPEELRKGADRLERLEEKIINIYASVMPEAKEDIQNLLNAETWFTANEAVEKGFAHSICDKCTEENKHDFAAFNYMNTPKRLLKKEHNAIGENNINNTAPTGGNQRKAVSMNLQELKAQHPETYNAAVQEGIKQERDRVTAHLTMGEGMGAMDIASKAIKDGEGMTATLNAQYMTAGMNKRDLNNREGDDSQTDATNNLPEPEKGEEGSNLDAMADEALAIFENSMGVTNG